MAPHPQKLTVTRRACPLARPYATALGLVSAVDVVAIEISDNDSRGRGEAVPVPRFGESIDSVVEALNGLKGAVSGGLARDTLQSTLPPGAVRNALDCAFWDMDAKRSYCTVAELAGLGTPGPITTATTVDFDTPAAMGAAATGLRGRPLLRLELGSEGDADRLQAVRQAAPTARIIVDAREQWDMARLRDLMPALTDCRVELIEQPLPADGDDALIGWNGAIPLCADESIRTRGDLDRIAGCYQAVRIGLDKAGGLTEALALAAEARKRGLRVMVGGEIGTSLALAPALLVAQGADWVDLEGPSRLAQDRAMGLRYEAGVIQPAEAGLWGGAG